MIVVDKEEKININSRPFFIYKSNSTYYVNELYMQELGKQQYKYIPLSQNN